jgi:hypothetical protein
MENYKVTYADGEVAYFQADTSDDAGKAWKEAMDAAVKDDGSNVKSVSKGDPPSADPPEGGN